MEKASVKNRNIRDTVLSPVVILTSMSLGIISGFCFPEFSNKMSYVGNLYLTMLQMCIIPVLFTAITYSTASLVKQKDIHAYLFKIFLLFFLGALFASILAIFTSVIFGLGKNFDANGQLVLGKLLAKVESVDTLTKANSSLTSFVNTLVPRNFFESLVKGEILSILFFSVVFGISLGNTPKSKSAVIFEFFEDLNQTFLRMINGLMYGLPLGLFCIFASQIANLGMEIFFTVFKIIIAIYISCVFAIFIHSLLIWRAFKIKYLSLFYALRKPMTVAFATASSFATIPSCLEALEENFGLDKKFTQLIIPLGICMNKQASTLMVCIISIFMLNVYNVHMTVSTVFILIAGSFLTGIALGGVPGIGAMSMLSIILNPLGIPVAPTIVIAVSVIPLIDPVVTVLNVFANCSTTILVAKNALRKEV